jgi:Reverse transcriptase (RNA-dependent DNA polymerase)
VEFIKLQALDTWKVVRLPLGAYIIGCRVVFDLKFTPNSMVDRFKTRLVAQGFSQRVGEDFTETFSPIIRAESLRFLLVLAASEDLEVL